MPDYLLTFIKPGDNASPINHDTLDFPVEQWQEWASPVWMSINQTNVLNARMSRDPSMEKHLCPLQLDVIERSLILWSNPGDVVLSPFMGIGSEGYMAVKLKRRFIGIELKESYWNTSCINLEGAAAQRDLFDVA
jgi:DNA modification methylase